MENCLLDRIGKREEVELFLKDEKKKELLIKYEDSKDCPEHFIKWIKDFIANKSSFSFNPIDINISSYNYFNFDIFSSLEKGLSTLQGFKEFNESYSIFATQNYKAIEEVIKKNKVIVNANVSKSLTENINFFTKLYISKKKINPERNRILKDKFQNALIQHPELLFIIQIDSFYSQTVLEKFKELIPREENINNKFIFVVKRLKENMSDIKITKIEEKHLVDYLEVNQNRLKLDEQKIEEFTSSIKKYPAKYSTIRSKAVEKLNFDEVKNCHKSTNF